MIRNRRLEYMQVKYFVKSPILYYIFLTAAILTFFIISLSVKLNVRQVFPAVLEGDVVMIQADKPPFPIDHRLFLYNNRNEKIFVTSIEEIKLLGGELHLYIDEAPVGLSGNVTVEITIDRETLLAKIFLKGGSSR